MQYLITITLMMLVVSGCADTMTLQDAAIVEPVGFWYGCWHGMILPLAWIVSLFDADVAIYAIYNNGGWYDFGFILGMGGLSSGAAASK